jgi:hypothetical protein
MDTELNPSKEGQKMNVRFQGGSSSPVYGIGLFGAWVYYIGRAETNQERVQGFFKAFAWPAILVYKMLKFLEKE